MGILELKSFFINDDYLSKVDCLRKFTNTDIDKEPISDNLLSIQFNMLKNSGVNISDIKETLNSDFKNILIFSKNRMLKQTSENEEFFEGYEYDESDIPELIESYYPSTVLFSFAIDYILLTKYEKKAVLDFFKKQKITSSKKFYNELFSYLPV